MISRKLLCIKQALQFSFCNSLKAKEPYSLLLSNYNIHQRHGTCFLIARHYCTPNVSSLIDKFEKNLHIADEDRKLLEKWLEMCKYEGEYVPENISERDLFELSEIKNEMKKKKYLQYLYKKEWASKNDKIRKEKIRLKKQEYKEELAKATDSHLNYGLWRNTMFSKTNEKTFIDMYHHRLASTMIHGQPIVIDLGFNRYLSGREIGSLAEQLVLSISLNRLNSEPFNLTFCNTDFEAKAIYNFNKRMPSALTSQFPMNIYSESYLDLFPKDRLVYLTPDCRNEMTTFDHDAIYIIGGIVDLGKQEPLTLAKAKKENIKMQKLPLDKYHIFKNNKSLSLHVMLAILLDLKNDGDWKNAFKNIPKRLLFTANETHDRWDRKRNPMTWDLNKKPLV